MTDQKSQNMKQEEVVAELARGQLEQVKKLAEQAKKQAEQTQKHEKQMALLKKRLDLDEWHI